MLRQEVLVDLAVAVRAGAPLGRTLTLMVGDQMSPLLLLAVSALRESLLAELPHVIGDLRDANQVLTPPAVHPVELWSVWLVIALTAIPDVPLDGPPPFLCAAIGADHRDVRKRLPLLTATPRHRPDSTLACGGRVSARVQRALANRRRSIAQPPVAASPSGRTDDGGGHRPTLHFVPEQGESGGLRAAPCGTRAVRRASGALFRWAKLRRADLGFPASPVRGAARDPSRFATTAPEASVSSGRGRPLPEDPSQRRLPSR